MHAVHCTLRLCMHAVYCSLRPHMPRTQVTQLITGDDLDALLGAAMAGSVALSGVGGGGGGRKGAKGANR